MSKKNSFTKEMQKALEADGEKLRQLTGKDHGPIWTRDENCICEHGGKKWFRFEVEYRDPIDNKTYSLEMWALDFWDALRRVELIRGEFPEVSEIYSHKEIGRE